MFELLTSRHGDLAPGDSLGRSLSVFTPHRPRPPELPGAGRRLRRDRGARVGPCPAGRPGADGAREKSGSPLKWPRRSASERARDADDRGVGSIMFFIYSKRDAITFRISLRDDCDFRRFSRSGSPHLFPHLVSFSLSSRTLTSSRPCPALLHSSSQSPSPWYEFGEPQEHALACVGIRLV